MLDNQNLEQLIAATIDESRQFALSTLSQMTHYLVDDCPSKSEEEKVVLRRLLDLDIILDQCFPDDFGDCFCLSQERNLDGRYRYSVSTIDRRSYFYFGEINHV